MPKPFGGKERPKKRGSVYGVPRHLDLSRFIDATLIQICLGQSEVQFHFQAAGSAASTGRLYIGVEGHWELRDPSGRIVDNAKPNSDREAYRLHRVLGCAVAGTAVDAPR